MSLSNERLSASSYTPVLKGDSSHVNWVIVARHGLKNALILRTAAAGTFHKMNGIADKRDQFESKYLNRTAIYARKQNLEIAVWLLLLRSSAENHETDWVQAIKGNCFDRRPASQHYANGITFTFQAGKTTVLVNCDGDKVPCIPFAGTSVRFARRLARR